MERAKNEIVETSLYQPPSLTPSRMLSVILDGFKVIIVPTCLYSFPLQALLSWFVSFLKMSVCKSYFRILGDMAENILPKRLAEEELASTVMRLKWGFDKKWKSYKYSFFFQISLIMVYHEGGFVFPVLASLFVTWKSWNKLYLIRGDSLEKGSNQ